MSRVDKIDVPRPNFPAGLCYQFIQLPESFRRCLLLAASLLIVGALIPSATAWAVDSPPTEPAAPETTTIRNAPRVYFIEGDSLDEEQTREKNLPLRLEKIQRESQLKALEVMEAVEALDALRELQLIPGLPEEIILPDTVYTTEITIGPGGIEFVDSTGDRTIITGRAVSPDAPFVFSEEGGRMITTKRSADIVQFGMDVVIAHNERVEGDVVVIGANLNVLGEVKGDAVAILGDVLVEGYVHGSAVAPFGKVTIGSSGRVRKNVEASRIDDRPGSLIGGRKKYTGVNLPGGPELIRGLYMTLLLAHLGLAVFLIFLTILCHVFAAKNIAVIKTSISCAGFKSFFVGILTEFLGIPVLFILLLITVIGIPVALLVLPIAVIIAGVLGYAAFGLILGQKLSENTGLKIKSQLGRTLVGVGTMLLLLVFGAAIAATMGRGGGMALFGVVGWIILGFGEAFTFIAVTTGIGAVVRTRFGTRPAGKKKTTPTSPTPALPPGEEDSTPALA